MRYSTIAAAAIAALTATGALAQDAPVITDQHAAAIDGDSNGKLTESEFLAYLGRAHQALDSDANGFVTWSEAEGRIIAEHFKALDTDGNNGVSLAEMETQGRADFASADRDGDGDLD